MRLGLQARPRVLLIRSSSTTSSNRWFSQSSESADTAPSSYQLHRPSRRNPVGQHSPLNPINVAPRDAVNHLRKIFSPLVFPEGVAQRITTHVSWERGVHGHNARFGFVGRRVLHTYLLLFLHECTLPPSLSSPPSSKKKASSISPSERLRTSELRAGGWTPLTQSYDDISDQLLNTYILGEHVGAAWELERVMRWTPAIAEMDTLRTEKPDTVLRSSGLYKVRGATVEGLMGGIFHQFGGSIAHRVFHTRVLPHIYKFGLPPSLHEKMREACDRLGGENSDLLASVASQSEKGSPLSVNPSPASIPPSLTPEEEKQGRAQDSFELSDNDGYVKVGKEERIRERRRMSSVG